MCVCSKIVKFLRVRTSTGLLDGELANRNRKYSKRVNSDLAELFVPCRRVGSWCCWSLPADGVLVRRSLHRYWISVKRSAGRALRTVMRESERLRPARADGRRRSRVSWLCGDKCDGSASRFHADNDVPARDNNDRIRCREVNLVVHSMALLLRQPISVWLILSTRNHWILDCFTMPVSWWRWKAVFSWRISIGRAGCTWG